MSNAKFISFKVKRYRSLMDVHLDVSNDKPTVICGENNIGKTNYLRALNLFFNHLEDGSLFKPEEDIPHHIYYGSRGAGSKTELIGKFLIDDVPTSLKVTFKSDGSIEHKINNKSCNSSDVKSVLNHFSFLFVESSNINLPLIMSEILEKDGLLSLDYKRRKQSEPLQKLNEFIVLAQDAIADIERDINKCFEKLTDFDGILKGKKIKINFAEFEKLRDVVKSMTSITLFDGNNNSIASKGSGAQRAVFIALMQYISQNSKVNIIWGVDEPEVFLQPKLQKKLSEVIDEIVLDKKQPVILTTHSQHFVSLKDLSSTHVFQGEVSQREYARKPNQIFFETNTSPIKVSSSFEKAMLIKNHLGINNNDGWELLPFNLLVEGEEDKKYLESLFAILNVPSPNIVWSGGASKIGGYLQYYNSFAKDLKYKPKFICILDNDDAGRDQTKRIKPSSYSFIDVEVRDLPRHDGKYPQDVKGVDWEIEDFLPPETIITAINSILRADGYKVIKRKQINNRVSAANINTQLLAYAEGCCSANNPDLDAYLLDSEGRKKQICRKLCDVLLRNNEINLNDSQEVFLKSLLDVWCGVGKKNNEPK